MFCNSCGNEISPESKFCPKCGNSLSLSQTPPVQTPLVQNNPNKSGKWSLFAILSIVVTGISYLLALWGTVAIAGIVLAVIALVKIPETGEKGKTLAIISIIIGALSIIYTFSVILGLIYY